MLDIHAEPRWAKLVPELLVTHLSKSLAFWAALLGFRVVYDRADEGFAYLDLDGAQLMLEQRSRSARQWETALLDWPLGRGVNFQIDVPDIGAIHARLAAAAWPLFMLPEERWYRAGDVERGVRQFLVQDPDGYLVRIAHDLGQRPI